MQQTIQFGQVQPSIVSRFGTIVKNLERWYRAKSETYSTLCGEEFTHGEVINVHAGIVAMYLFGALVKMAVAWMEGGAL
jgi:hypothetical protein